MGNWYAVKTEPGAQQPQREYKVEKTASAEAGKPRGKGYRIVPSLNPNISAVELALRNRGFEVYMPAERRLVRDRKHTDLWKPRRFALLVGYVFVHDPRDWVKLERTEGVAYIVKNQSGMPLPMDWDDILMLRSIEAEGEAVFDIQLRNARKILKKKAKSDKRLMELAKKLDLSMNFSVPMQVVEQEELAVA